MYDHLDDAAIEAQIRERASAQNCELVIERLESGEWRVALNQSSALGAGLAPRGFVLYSVDAPEKRDALEDVLAALEVEDEQPES